VLGRRKRFERLLGLRERELDNRSSDVARAKKALESTRLALEESQHALREAALRWRVEPGDARPAAEWSQAGDWLQTRVLALERAMKTQNLAKERVRQTTVLLQQAEREKRKIEKLLERIALEEKQLELVADQKATDELAARIRAAE